jgi:hypothetical protein
MGQRGSQNVTRERLATAELRVVYPTYLSVLKMEAVCSSEMVVDFYTRLHNVISQKMVPFKCNKLHDL